ncbi:MAG: Npun_F5749 family FMN-dependent PPOX-type flavoprotein, partial [Pseudanabaena sp. ELA607]
LAHTLHAYCHQPKACYLQLATVDQKQRPTNRTLVFRGFWAETNWLKFITDTRSQKYTHLQQQPWAEACWYFPKTREQFRIAGQLHPIIAPHPEYSHPPNQGDSPTIGARNLARVQQWRELSDAARLQFAWPAPKDLRDSDLAQDQALFHPESPDTQNPPPHFCLLLLEPHQVDYLKLRGEPQNRYLYSRLLDQESWQFQEVNP